jgi:hypothetical protein
MRILNIRPSHSPGALAHFDVEVTEHLRLFNLTLRHSKDGALRAFSPKACGKHAATFHPILAQQIIEAAKAALEGPSHVKAQ